MACLHTGFADTLLSMNRQPDVELLHKTGSGLDGWDSRLLNWIVDSRLACSSSRSFRHRRPCGVPDCRSMSTACSRTASIWASSGT
jgi:hypothetical protein